jgi:K+-transporting ATPase ATPase B chain
MIGSQTDISYGLPNAKVVKFSAETRSSGIDVDGRSIRKGAFDAMAKSIAKYGNKIPAELKTVVEKISANGGTPLVVAENNVCPGAIELQDVIKPGITERFERLRKMGVKTVMVTGDNKLTAKYIAQKAGVMISLPKQGGRQNGIH